MASRRLLRWWRRRRSRVGFSRVGIGDALLAVLLLPLATVLLPELALLLRLLDFLVQFVQQESGMAVGGLVQWVLDLRLLPLERELVLLVFSVDALAVLLALQLLSSPKLRQAPLLFLPHEPHALVSLLQLPHPRFEGLYDRVLGHKRGLVAADAAVLGVCNGSRRQRRLLMNDGGGSSGLCVLGCGHRVGLRCRWRLSGGRLVSRGTAAARDLLLMGWLTVACGSGNCCWRRLVVE